MNQNIVVLSPHFPPHYHRFWSQIKKAGGRTLGIGDEPFEKLSPEQQASLTEYFRIENMHDYDALVRACGYFTHRYGKIDRFESLNEYWLETEAKIRDDFNICGVRQAQIGFIRKKSLMKERFLAAGVRVALGQIVHNQAEAKTFIAQVGYPVVAKPDRGVGALHTYRINNDFELENFFLTKPNLDYIMEEFISGEIHSFDGLADSNGNILFCTSHVFSQGIMETVNEARHIFYYSLRKIPAELEKLGRACVHSFEVKERFFHIEFFCTPQGEYVALEVNMRPPGGYTTDMFNYSADFDVYRTWAELVVHQIGRVDFERQYHCCYASRKNGLRYRHSHEEIMHQYGCQILQVQSVPGVFSSALGDIGYIFRTSELVPMFEIVRFVHETANR